MNRFLSSIILGLFAIVLQAQPTTKVTYEMMLEVADEAAKNHDYYTAIEWFGNAYRESKDVNLQIAMADLYILARDYDRAQKIYERTLSRDKRNEYADLKYDLARVNKFQGQYQEAYKLLNEVLNDEAMSDDIKMAATKELEGIEMMKGLNDNLEAVITYVKGGVNSGSAESSPAIGPEGELYFSSFNSKREIIFDGEQGDYHAKIFNAKANDKGEYDKPRPLNDKVNREGFNSGGVSFSRDGRRMYFTRAKLNNNAIDKSTIMYSDLSDRGWGAAYELPSINGDFISKHPVEGELFGVKVLFFVSDMDGGQGGDDIYYANIEGDKLGSPVNLGPSINTAGDEISPFYMNGTLYFASNGLPNIGGFDLFYATWNGSAWETPVNMGFNYNTSYDDMFLRLDNSGRNGFLVSNRPDKEKSKIKGSETCCDDIYSVYIKELVIDLATEVEDDKGPLNGATIEVYDLTSGEYPDSKTNIDKNSFNFSLDADRKYKAVITREGYFADSIEFNTVGIIDDYTVKKKVVLKKDPNWGKKDEVEIIATNQAIRLNNIYYDLDDAKILPDAERDLSVLLDLMYQYPDMVIELSSHTDAQGKASYNQKLSQRRSESAKAWLVNEGVDASRIKAVGYGESIILNRCVEGVRCSDDEHRFNRRTEFKILSGPTTIEIKKEALSEKKK